MMQSGYWKKRWSTVKLKLRDNINYSIITPLITKLQPVNSGFVNNPWKGRWVTPKQL